MGTIELLSRERSRVLYTELAALNGPHGVTAGVNSTNTRNEAKAQCTGCANHNQKESRTKGPIPETLMALIRVWLNRSHPFLHQGALFEHAGIASGSKQSTLKKAALTHGLIREHRIQRARTKLSIWEPLEMAYKAADIRRPHFKSKGGYLHAFIAHHIACHGHRNGYQSRTEFLLSNNKAVDVVLQNADETVFVEIAVSKPLEKEITNIRKDLETDLVPSRLVVVTLDAKMKATIAKLIRADTELNERSTELQVMLAGEFIETKTREV
jgi:hypothetical protein